MIHLHIACNDHRNGIHTGQVKSIQFFGSDDVDPMLMLNGGPLRCHLWRSTKSRKTRFLRLGHIPAIRVVSYTTWVGNWCWDSALVSDADAAKVANYLRKRGWQNEGGWVDIGEKWDSEEPFTEKDFQAQHDPAIICTECGKPSPAGLFYAGDRQLCGPCAEKYI